MTGSCMRARCILRPALLLAAISLSGPAVQADPPSRQKLGAQALAQVIDQQIQRRPRRTGNW